MNKLTDLLKEVKLNKPLNKMTSFQVGGPAEYFIKVKSAQELFRAIKAAIKAKVDYTVIGGGSNVLISDKGIKGLVIKNLASNILVLPEKEIKSTKIHLKPRFQSLDSETQKLNQKDYDLSEYKQVLVKLESGVTLPRAIFSLINQGITGLEWFAGIPATVGGATYINLHGADKYWSDYLVEAEIIDSKGDKKIVAVDYFNYGYDDSKIKKSKEVILSVTLRLFKGPKVKALAIAKEWAAKKSHQPQRSSGCIFQNLDEATQEKLKLPTPSIGYIMDNVLNLKGKSIGKAQIASKHAGFIENLGGAKAQDIFKLIKLMQVKAKEKLGINLKLEIVPLGFTRKELEAIGENN